LYRFLCDLDAKMVTNPYITQKMLHIHVEKNVEWSPHYESYTGFCDYAMLIITSLRFGDCLPASCLSFLFIKR
jgi:hypothetical protein